MILAERETVMDRHAQIVRRSEALDRLLAVLLVLVDLADWAANAPRPVGWIVFWALRQAHRIPDNFVARSPCNGARSRRALAPLLRREAAGSAVDFAASFRILARTVKAMAAQCRRQAFLLRRRTKGRRLWEQPRLPILHMSAAPARPADTS